MTLNQTRQLGIEFERRIQAVMPQEEILNKLDTETIYSYLNEFQMKYVHDIYRNLDKLEPGTTLTTHVESVLQSMLTTVTLKDPITTETNPVSGWNDIIADCGRSITYQLPDNYYTYIRSVSTVDKTFSWQTSQASKYDIIPNIYTKQTDIWKLLETPHNKLRILRYPAVVLNEYDGEDDSRHGTITIIHDRYTHITGIKVTYYKQPMYFSLMTSTPCELPMDAFNDLVEGAVALYLNYYRGGIRQQEEEGRRDRFNRRQAERENENQNNEQQ